MIDIINNIFGNNGMIFPYSEYASLAKYGGEVKTKSYLGNFEKFTSSAGLKYIFTLLFDSGSNAFLI